jgi:hypothetical protein
MLRSLFRSLSKSPKWLVVTIIVASLSLVAIVGMATCLLAYRVERLEHGDWIVDFDKPPVRGYKPSAPTKPASLPADEAKRKIPTRPIRAEG